MTDVNLHGASVALRKSYSWLQRNWRTLTHPRTGAPFPLPFVGAEKGGSPVWRLADIEAWKAGESPADTQGHPTQRAAPERADNDAAPRRLTNRAQALRAAAGG